MTKLARHHLSDQISQILSRRIIHRRLGPGEAVYETQVSRELGVSRSPVREALRMLEQIHLVERTPRGGYQVTEFSDEQIRHFYETAIVLYRYAFARAAENATQTDIEDLESDLEDLVTQIENRDFEGYLVTVTKMGRRILAIAGNPIIERFALELMPTAERVQYASITYLPAQLKTVLDHLRRAYQCMIRKDPHGAAQAFEDFASAHVKVVIDSMEEAGKQPGA
jgi:DNA-binding GntR family transcriptional regulator